MSRWKRMRAIVMICAALGWWNVWFPELAVWADAIRVVEETPVEDGSVSETVQLHENVVKYEDVREICDGLLSAGREQIRLKSRLLVLLEQYLRK